MVYPNHGDQLLQKWTIKCKNKNGESKIQDFIKSTKTKNPTGGSGPNDLPPIGSAYMDIESSGNNHDIANDDVWVSWERTDIIDISSITFYHNRFSTSDAAKRNMGRLDIQLLRNGNWQIEFTIEKNTNFSIDESTWTLLNMIIISQPNYRIKLLYSGLNSAHSDMGVSNISLTHSFFNVLYGKY